MVWNAGVDRLTGDIVTAADWNKYMGAAGSLEYLYALAGTGGSIPTQSESSGVKTLQAAAVQSTKGAYVQLFAATSMASMNLVICTDPESAVDFALDIATGAGGAEVVKVADLVIFGGAAATPLTTVIPFTIALGARVAGRVANLTSAAQWTLAVGLTVLG